MKELAEKEEYHLLVNIIPESQIVVGAPHHAPGGITKLPCPEHEDSDENTGVLAKILADRLKCSYVIACNPRIDPNKELTTEYSKAIVEAGCKYLIEIHGHGGKRVLPNGIEISSGAAKKQESVKFARLLQQHFEKHDSLKSFTISGDFDKVYFKAKNTATINSDRWISYHIELPPNLRLGIDKQLPSNYSDLIEALFAAIKENCF